MGKRLLNPRLAEHLIQQARQNMHLGPWKTTVAII